MKKILLSLLSIGAVAAVAVYATGAYFSDTETSVGNTFIAGDIDLQIDNESYALDWNIPGYQEPVGDLVVSDQTSWELKDLTIERFFNFWDLKPGDYGEDTISVHVGSNDAWLCAAAQITDDNDSSYTSSELLDDATVDENDPEGMDGELDEEVNFAFWVDDGDNVLEAGEENGIFLQGPISAIDAQGQIALADTSYSILGDANPIPGDTTFYIGKAWCFGEMTTAPEVEGDGTPIERGTGFSCDGSGVNNASQTDRVEGDLQFYAEQARHNDTFLCSENYSPEWLEAHRLVLENKNPDNWDEVYTQDGKFGVLTWAGNGPTFDFSTTLKAYGLEPDTEYALIYYADPWPGDNPGAFLGSGTTDGSGYVEISGNVDLGHDLPDPEDANSPGGAKIWLVLNSDYNNGSKTTGPMTGWQPERYLFETELIQYIDTAP
jgi:predicted ribosomally synthesized peptide with SipW-like signal peptide